MESEGLLTAETIDADEGVKASLKRRDPPENDTSEPKKPESAYAFYCAERIPAIKAGHPEMSLAEINTTTLSEWNDLPTDKKQRYSDAAAADEARYAKEHEAFTEMNGPLEKKPKIVDQVEEQSGEQLVEPPSEETKQNGKPTRSPGRPPSRQDYVLGTNVHIFTDQFMQHNREMDSELRRLHTTNAKLKEENALLNSHITSMQALASRLGSEVKGQQDKNGAIQAHLHRLREAVVAAFKDLAIPGFTGSPTLHTADECVNILNTIVGTAAVEHAELVARVTKQLEEQLSNIQNM